MPDSNHIVILCSYLNFAGGYERIIVDTANLFSQKGIRTSLVILGDTEKSFYPISDHVHVIQKPIHFGITEKGNMITRKIKMIGDILTLKKLLKEIKADTVICTEYPFVVGAILSGAKRYSRVISWEHTHYNGTKRNFFWQQLFKFAYPKLDIIVCLNREEETYFKKLSNTCIIPNFTQNKSGSYAQPYSKKILSIGSLIPRKGIDLLLIAAKKVLSEHNDWQWKLIGSGEMKNQVLSFIKSEKLEDRFILQASVSSNLNTEYASASFFVLSSRSETLPMVLLEAMSFGLPCISFDCPSGPSAIINSDDNGILVEKENAEKLALAISSLIIDDEKRKKMGENALESSKSFSPDLVFKLWVDKVFNT